MGSASGRERRLMGYYPIIMDLTGRKCLVVGGGEVALRKVKSLVEAGAHVTVIAPSVHSDIQAMDGVCVEARLWREGDASGYALIFAATNDEKLNAAVSCEAQSRAIPVNVVDDPDKCSFIVPSCVRRGDLLISVTTSGKSPALCKRIRLDLEKLYEPEFAEFVDLLGELRDAVKCKYSEQADREAAFGRLIDCGIMELLRSGERDQARKKALECI